MAAPTIKGWKKSAAGTERDYNASIDKSGENSVPFACSFISADAIDIDYQRAVASGDTFAIGKKFVSVGESSTVYAYIDSGVVKVDSIVSSAVADTVSLDPYIVVAGDVFIRDLYIDHVQDDLYVVFWIGGNAGQFLSIHLISVAGDGTITDEETLGYGNDSSAWEFGWVWKYWVLSTSRRYYFSVYDSSPNFTNLVAYVNPRTNAMIVTSSGIQDPPTATHLYYYQPKGIEGALYSYFVYYDGSNIKYTENMAAHPIVWTTMTGGTGYQIVAIDISTEYVYAIKDDILYYGEITDASPDTIAWTMVLNYGSGFTLIDVDSNNAGTILIVLNDGVSEYMLSYSTLAEIGMTNAIVSYSINSSQSECRIKCRDNSNLYSAIGALTITDRNGDDVFGGYPKPSNLITQLTLDGYSKEFKVRMTNRSFAAQTLHDMAAFVVGDSDSVEIGTNNLDDVDTFTQQWGSSVPQHVALETLGIVGSAYYRVFLNQCDIYLNAARNSSTKKIVFGETSAELIEELGNEIQQINKLVVFGAYVEDSDGSGTAGVLQVTNEDTDDQAIRGIIPLYIRRNDLETFDMVDGFATEIWTERKSTEDNIYVYKIRVHGSIFLKAGDTIAVENGNLVSQTMVDTTYMILKAETDIVQQSALLWLCTSIAPAQHIYNDVLSTSAQTPEESASDSTQGDQSDKVSITDVLAGQFPIAYNDLIVPISNAKLPASNYPSWSSFTANTYAFKFDVDEYVDVQPSEMLHDWIEGTTILPHLHIVLSAATASEQVVQFRMYYSWGDVDEVMAGESYVDGEITIPISTSDRTHLIVEFDTIDASGFKIGSIGTSRIKRIDVTAGTELIAEPFVMMFGLHYEVDTIGSKAVWTK